jgi:hypothetical protein
MVRSRIADIGKGTSQERVAKAEISSDGNYLVLLDFSGIMKEKGMQHGNFAHQPTSLQSKTPDS